MTIKNIAFAVVLASFAAGAAQAQPAAGTPGTPRGATVPAPAAGTQTPAGMVQGTTSPSGTAAQGGAAPTTVPISPPQAAGAHTGMHQGHTAMPPGSQARSAQDMGAGRPGTPMPPGSIAGDAPGMGGPRTPPR